LAQKLHTIEHNTAPYSGGGLKKIVAEVEACNVMPEAVGVAYGLRMHHGVKGNFFVVSLGFGTCEAILSTDGGVVQRSSLSTYGLRYAINALSNTLSFTHYLELKNEHQLDVAFKQGFIFANRKRLDISDIRAEVLRQYYNDVISPNLAKAFDDNDFAKSSVIYLTGGGAMLPELVACFQEEFKDIVEIKVPDNASSLAAIGYAYNSLIASGGDKGRAMGIDIGNSSTIICNFSNSYQANN